MSPVTFDVEMGQEECLNLHQARNEETREVLVWAGEEWKMGGEGEEASRDEEDKEEHEKMGGGGGRSFGGIQRRRRYRGINSSVRRMEVGCDEGIKRRNRKELTPHQHHQHQTTLSQANTSHTDVHLHNVLHNIHLPSLTQRCSTRLVRTR
eukprot:GHVQ01017187.1.p1 GENE.GHVQ01017187.1~~GHVQ01017187.1.p1  ORF type:complete len:151 (+),score=46.95 GHVQ01017187.1:147-599(+)